MLKRAIFFSVVICLFATGAYGQKVFPFLGVITSDRVNVRAGQNVNFEQLTKLNKGEQVVVIKKDYSWYKVKLPASAKCYISAKYIKKLKNNIGRVKADRVNLRAEKGEKYSSLGQVNKGTLVKIIERTNDWYRIESPQEGHGWIHNKFVSFKSTKIPTRKVIVLSTKKTRRRKPPKSKASIYNKAKSAKVLEKKAKPAVAKKKEPPKSFSAIGYVEDLGRILQERDIRYKLVIDGKTAYYLKGPRHIIDSFVHYKARVKGRLREGSERLYSFPVIVVRKINLIL